MVSLVLPTGSLENPTLQLFSAAGLAVHRANARSCRARIDYPDIDQVAFYKPREIPHAVADGAFDIGLTGSDWIEESAVKVERVHGFGYSKTTSTGWRVALAVHRDHPATTVDELPPGTRVASEYPGLTRSWFAEREQAARVAVVESYGATEGKIPELADAVVEVVETGASLLHNDLRVLTTLRHCGPTVIANPQCYGRPATRAAVDRIATLLRAAEAGANHVLLTVAAPADRLPDLEEFLPTRWWCLPGHPDGAAVVQALVARGGIARTVTGLVDAGAVEIVETPVGMHVRRDGGP